MTGAGFGDPKIEEVAFTFTYDDFDFYWRAVTELAGPIARAIEALPDDDQQAVKDEVAAQIEQFKRNGGYEIPATPIGVLAEAG